jgi:putative ABC transport system permease protein
MTRSRLRAILVAAQVTVSMTLLITAGLLTRGLFRSQATDAGFDTRSLYLLSGDFAADPAKTAARQQRLIDRVRALPEVSHVTQGSEPLAGTWTPPMVVGNDQDRALASYASDTYFETLGIPVLRGRGFTREEVARNAPVAVISEATARRFWPRKRRDRRAVPARHGFSRDHGMVRGDRRGQGRAIR